MRVRTSSTCFSSLMVLGGLLAPSVQGQWTNRYPRVEGTGHHVYLEGYELPTMNAGPTAPAVSPDGTRVSFSARGWIWILDPASGRAERVTDGPAMDFRPAWSPDGRRLAFVRDDSNDTWIVVLDLETGAERVVDSPTIDLDPVFGPDGGIVYASAASGRFDLWEADGARITTDPGFELGPSLSADGTTLVYMTKGGGTDRIVARDLATGEVTELVSEGIMSQTRPAVSPDGRLVAYNWPAQDGYELRLVAVGDPSTSVLLTRGERGLPLSPAWSPDGRWIWFTEAGADEVMRLYRIASTGGPPEEVAVRAWDWAGEVGTVRVVTRMAGASASAGPAPARLSVVDDSGHPVVPTAGYAQFDGQHGRVFFYSSGVIEVVVPAGTVTVSAVQGLTTPEVSRTVEVRPEQVTEVSLTLEPVWDARAAGYLSGDHHFHLNYGGPYRLDPDDLLPFMAGENLDVATPLIANLHNRFEDQPLWGWERGGGVPLIRFGQEVRSHFLGHVSLLDTRTLFWPWIWGPGYQAYGLDDRPNGEALAHARAEGGLGGYVHPVRDSAPFAPENAGHPPVMLVVDGILGNMDWIELAVLWTDEIGAAEMWYRFLNLGVPIVLEAGTDAMNNFYRTMPVGVSRLYVQTGGAENMSAYLRAMSEGRSFVTTGPMLDFRLGGGGPGDVVPGGETVAFSLTLASAVPVDTVEILVNGDVVWVEEGLSVPGDRVYEGSVEVPDGGWVAARARGGLPTWPASDSYAFAHTGAVWIGHVGSTDGEASRRAAAELTPIVNAAEERLRAAYGDVPTPLIDEQFAAARRKLERYD